MHQTNNPRSALPFHAAASVKHGAAPAGEVGAVWRIQYGQGVADGIEAFESSDAATEAACRLLDSGSDVVGIGMGIGSDKSAIGRERLALIYALWVRARYH
jgi:hypothetical protein